ncbi:elongator complex protein 5 isoform X5 [Rousettus aegyptiacus]|uniref:elongator complex protein 5 isoform X5 n=1 Tax=Rousettus aegyptiacus TaxID=9407 RepID=UPI00168CF8F3|nr:elongator complex protein 5 isoform X5 [Rousettus aegyptiacus]
MLESLLAVSGLVLLRDSVQWEGRSLLKALIKKSVLCGEQVHILGCEVSEEEFREGFDASINSQLVYLDLYRDPLNWSKTGEAFPGGLLGVLRAMRGKTDPRPVTIALDSLSWLLLHLPCTTLCQTLYALNYQDSSLGFHPECSLLPFMPYVLCPSPGDSSPVQQVRVLGLLHEELHGPGPVGALSSLAQSEVTLSGTAGQASAHILYRRPQQHPTVKVDPTTHLTFNLHLSKKEKEAKDNLTLPFQFSSEKQQALLCPSLGQATSYIFYEPDVYDDLDQEDPDDDLDI